MCKYKYIYISICNTFRNVFKATPVIVKANHLYKYNQTQQKTSEGLTKCD